MQSDLSCDSRDSELHGKSSGMEETDLKAQQEKFQSNPDSYNGAQRETYCWSQTILDIDVKIPVSKNIKKGKQVKVVIDSDRINVQVLEESGWNTVVDDKLSWPITKNTAVWSLVPGECVQINLEKVQERWWEALLQNEPKIDVKHINCERPMDDLPDEEQAKIQELMFDDHQKKLGKPTVQEIKMQELLREAWDKDGSPFRGQPFDPSICSFNNSDTAGTFKHGEGQ